MKKSKTLNMDLNSVAMFMDGITSFAQIKKLSINSNLEKKSSSSGEKLLIIMYQIYTDFKYSMMGDPPINYESFLNAIKSSKRSTNQLYSNMGYNTLIHIL